MPEILRGDLGSVHLPSLLQLAEAERLSGQLKLGEDASVAFSDGLIAGATCGPLQDMEALTTLFFIEQGSFHFEQEAASNRPAITPLIRVILEGVRLLDEWARVGPMVLAPAGPLPSVGAAETQVLARLDGVTPLHRAVVAAATSPALIIDTVLSLLEEGRLTERAAPGPLPPWPGVRALRPETSSTPPVAEDADDDLDEGRRLLRAGLLEEAEEAFRRVLALRADDPIARQNLRHVQRMKAHGGQASPLLWLNNR